MIHDNYIQEGNLITEPAYWRDPVQVFAGAFWLLVGLLFGLGLGTFVL